MDGSIPATLLSLFEAHGMLALFGLFLLEGAMLLYIAPSESLVPAAFLLLGNTPIDYAIILVVTVIASTIGQTLLFLLAKRKGRAYLLSKSWFRVSDERLTKFDSWFDRWGPLAVPVSNMLLFTRGMLSVPAGLAEMDTRRFIILSAAGTLVFETVLGLLALGVINWF